MTSPRKRIAASTIAMAMSLSACGGGGGSPAPPPSGSAPTPAPTSSPTPVPASFVGALYVGTNNFGDAGNYVVAFGRSSDGTLTPIDAFPTNGAGRGVTRDASGPIRLNPLISEDSLIEVDGRYLLVVNAGSNTITSFRINADFSLSIVDQAPSGGVSPISLAHRNGVVYVANADSDGVFTGPSDQSGNVSGLRLDLASGSLAPIGGSTRELGVRPANIEFSADGRHLVVSGVNAGSAMLASRGTAEISSFGVMPDGALTAVPRGAAASPCPGMAQGETCRAPSASRPSPGWAGRSSSPRRPAASPRTARRAALPQPRPGRSRPGRSAPTGR